MAPKPGGPFEVRLPSGSRARVTGQLLDPPPRSLLEAVERGAVEADLDLLGAPLADAHIIEAILVAMRVIAVPNAALECRNCEESVEIAVADAILVEPLLDPPGDPELDDAMLGEHEHPLPAPLPIRGAHAETFRLGPRTLRDRAELERLLGDDPEAPLPLSPALVRALGLTAVGEVKSPSSIARALAALPEAAFDAAWDTMVEAFDRQHWPPRLLVPTPCPRCGARHDLEAAGPRPLGLARRPEEPDQPFPSLATFKAVSRRIVHEVLADMPATEIDGLEVVVDDRVPPCDDGGEPLLGSYTPSRDAHPDPQRATTAPFCIELYYRTFRSMYADEPYDVEAEVRETLVHELEHHRGFLLGDDPLDDAERAEIEAERVRLRGGKPARAGEVAAGLGWLAGDFGRFIRAMWPVLLIAIGLYLGLTMCGR